MRDLRSRLRGLARGVDRGRGCGDGCAVCLTGIESHGHGSDLRRCARARTAHHDTGDGVDDEGEQEEHQTRAQQPGECDTTGLGVARRDVRGDGVRPALQRLAW